MPFSQSRSRSPAQQVKRCCYVINIYAIDTQFRSLPAAVTDAVRICFAYTRPHPVPIHCTGAGLAGATGHCETTATFDSGMIKYMLHA